MIRTIIESPLSGDFKRNIRYARLCMQDCLDRGETPYASHLLITQIWDDLNGELRKRGMAAGHAWYPGAQRCAEYIDIGVSDGMLSGIAAAVKAGVEVCRGRRLPPYLMSRLDDDALAGTEGAV